MGGVGGGWVCVGVWVGEGEGERVGGCRGGIFRDVMVNERTRGICCTFN